MILPSVLIWNPILPDLSTLCNSFYCACAANVERWERSVNDDEEELERAKQAEAKQMGEIDREMRELDRHKSERMAKKNELDVMDEEVAKARRDVGLVAKDLQTVQKAITGLEVKIDQKKSERHSILKQSKVFFASFSTDYGTQFYLVSAISQPGGH